MSTAWIASTDLMVGAMCWEYSVSNREAKPLGLKLVWADRVIRPRANLRHDDLDGKSLRRLMNEPLPVHDLRTNQALVRHGRSSSSLSVPATNAVRVYIGGGKIGRIGGGGLLIGCASHRPHREHRAVELLTQSHLPRSSGSLQKSIVVIGELLK